MHHALMHGSALQVALNGDRICSCSLSSVTSGLAHRRPLTADRGASCLLCNSGSTGFASFQVTSQNSESTSRVSRTEISCGVTLIGSRQVRRVMLNSSESGPWSPHAAEQGVRTSSSVQSAIASVRLSVSCQPRAGRPTTAPHSRGWRR